MPKKILLVVRWPVGGIRTYMRYVYTKMDKDKYSFTVIGPDISEFEVLASDLERINAKYVPVNTRGFYGRFIKKIFAELVFGNYDLVHSHGFTSGVLTSPIASIARTPHVMTSHDVLRTHQFKGLRGYFKKLVLSTVLPLIDAIQSVSHDAEQNLVEFIPKLKRHPQKLLVIPNGIEIERFADITSRPLRKELGLPDDTFLIGFLGRFMSQKGFDVLVDAVELLSQENGLPKVPIVIGVGSGGFFREDQQMMLERNLGHYFRFIKFEANIASLLSGLDLVVMPSRWEAAGLVAMEALVAGIPLIGTNCLGLREVLANTPATVVEVDNAKQLARAMIDYMETPKKEYFKNFVEEAKQRFNAANTAYTLESLYNRLFKDE